MTLEDQLSLCIKENRLYFFNYAKKKGVDPSDIDDVLQITFIQAFQKLDRFDPERNLKSWIVGIMNYRMLDHFRKRNRHSLIISYVEEIPDDRLVEAEASPDLEGITKRCFEKLHFSDRQILHMRYKQRPYCNCNGDRLLAKYFRVTLTQLNQEIKLAKQRLNKLLQEELAQ